MNYLFGLNEYKHIFIKLLTLTAHTQDIKQQNTKKTSTNVHKKNVNP